jgi:hypothetical protein
MAEKRTRLSDMTKAGRKAEKPTVIGAIRDPQFVRDVLQGLGETATRGITGVLGAPVDITTMAMRPFGYSVPAEQVVGGSEYLGKQMERAGMLSGNRNTLSELLAGLVTPDPMDVAKLGAMAVPVVGRVARQAPRDEALKIAQANAAKPVSEGGLGLPPDNTAMERAKAMGFDVNNPLYHATDKDFESFDLSKSADIGAHFGTPQQANTFTVEQYGKKTKENARVLPVYLRGEKSLDIDFDPTIFPDEDMALKGDHFNNNLKNISENMGVYDIYADIRSGNKLAEKALNAANSLDKASVKFVQKDNLRDLREDKKLKKYWENVGKYIQSKGYDRIDYANEIEGEGTSSSILNPANIRSRFAAFDPARRYESDLLGAADPRLLGAIGLGTAGAVYKTNREKEKDRKREK